MIFRKNRRILYVSTDFRVVTPRKNLDSFDLPRHRLSPRDFRSRSLTNGSAICGTTVRGFHYYVCAKNKCPNSGENCSCIYCRDIPVGFGTTCFHEHISEDGALRATERNLRDWCGIISSIQDRYWHVWLRSFPESLTAVPTAAAVPVLSFIRRGRAK